jgi:D-serine deaminase-like pyridoxal phosphate-dependent protein
LFAHSPIENQPDVFIECGVEPTFSPSPTQDTMLPDPPPGWTALQERAKQAKDPRQLAAIIDEMNKLLSEYEKAAGNGHSEVQRSARGHKSDKNDGR